MTTKLYLDIETLPCEEDKREEFVDILKKRKEWQNREQELLQHIRDGALISTDSFEEEIFRSTALDGTFGQILCIGLIKETGEEVTGKQTLSGSEDQMLKKFWEVASGVQIFIGHNIMDFDLPFIYKRSIILGVKPSREINFARYRNEPIFDTQKEWDKWAFGHAHKLDTLARVLGIRSSKDKMDGSEVYDFYKAGKLDDIYEYCMKDVLVTRQVYKRLTFQQ